MYDLTVSAPVLLIGFNRPDFIAKRLNELEKSHTSPSKVIISIDGAKSTSASDSHIVDFYEKVCRESLLQPSIMFRKENLGCSRHVILAVSEVLSEYHEVVVFEDDIVIGERALCSILEGLEILKHEKDIGVVGAYSPFHRPIFPLVTHNRWRKSKFFSAWGWGTSSEFWSKFKPFSEIDDLDSEIMNSQIWAKMSKRKKRVWIERFRRGVWDYNVQFNLFCQSKLVLLPTMRLIDNEGFDSHRSTHTRHKRPWTMFGKGYSKESPRMLNRVGSKPFSKYVWGFIDSNLWAGDGIFSTRARSAGIRTIIRKLVRAVLPIVRR